MNKQWEKAITNAIECVANASSVRISHKEGLQTIKSLIDIKNALSSPCEEPETERG